MRRVSILLQYISLIHTLEGALERVRISDAFCQNDCVFTRNTASLSLSIRLKVIRNTLSYNEVLKKITQL